MKFRTAVYSTIILAGTFCFGQALPQPGVHTNQPMSGMPTMGMPGMPASPDSPEMGTTIPGSLEGEVRSGDNRPVSNARVELVDPSTGSSVASTYTGPLGNFEFRGIRRGSYEIMASSGVYDTREQVEVMGPSMMVTLRMLNLRQTDTSTTSVGGRHTVSVNALKVPDKAREELEKARKEMEKQRMPESLKHVENALTIAPNFAEALTLRGIIEVASNQGEQARKDLQQAINQDPSYGLSYVVMGASLTDEAKYAEAVRPLSRALELMPASWQAHFEMSRALLGTGDFQHALKEATRAEDMMGNFPPIHLVRAHALLGCKDYSNAITEYEAYLSKDSTGPQAEKAREALDEARSFAAANGPGQ